MSLYELLDIFSLSGQKLDALWQFYVTIHLAIFGALFVFHKIKTHQIVISVISYLAFSIINLRAKIYEYQFYNSLIKEIKNKELISAKSIDEFFKYYNADDRITVTITVHIVSFILLLYLFKKSKKC